jgi:hypothetical protein
MNHHLAVAYSPAADATGALSQVIAALPVSLRPASDAGELVGIDGALGWSAAAADAITAGARGLVIIDPVNEDITSLREKADAAGVPVVIDAVWTHSPAASRSANAFGQADDEHALLEVRANVPIGSDLDRVLLGQLSLVRALATPVVGMSVVRWNQHGYDVLATLDSGARASFAAVVTNALPHSAHVRVLKATTAVELTLPSPTTAAPGKAVVSGPDGATLLVTEFETPHRAAWRRAHHLVVAQLRSSDLDDFAADSAIARAVRSGTRA